MIRPCRNRPSKAWLMLALLCLFSASAGAQGIYSCVDAHGRRLTSDRPIAECRDREQTEWNASGTVRRKIAPEPTAMELEAKREQARREAEQQAAQDEVKRRARALLNRYPNQVTHDKERQREFEQIDAAIKSALKRKTDLAQQRKTIDAEMEFFQKNPASAPAALRKQLEANTQDMRSQDRFVADQEAEKKKINSRFDAELSKLRPMWGQALPASTSPAPTTSTSVSPAPASITR